MHVQVVEVCLRIGDELRDVAYLPGGTYDAGVCEVRIAEARERLAASPMPIVMTHGLATITLRLVEPPTTVVPRRRIEWRPVVYGAGSLASHLAVLVVALWFGGEIMTPSVSGNDKGRRARISSRFAAPAQTTKWAPNPEPKDTAITVDDTPSPVPSVDDEENGGREHDTPESEPIDTGGDQTIAPPHTDGGRQRRFDPDASAEFDTVKVGAFSTVSTGRLTGEHYGAEAKRAGLIVVSCDATSCLVLGGEAAAPIRKAVEDHLAEITACYANQSGVGGKKIEIDLGLANGKVDNLSVGGLGDVGNCVADILKQTTFDQEV